MSMKRKNRNLEQQSDDEPHVKRKPVFSGKLFRTNIKGDNAVTAVKEFVTLCKSAGTQNVVLEYLDAGGGALELLELLQSDNKKNMAVVVPVFSALQFIIVSALTDAQRYKASTEEACKHLLNQHLSTVHDMLSLKSTAKYRQIVLKLLAAMVTLSPQLARMILSHVKVSPRLWSVLTKHTEPVDKSVRTSFIHFLMAFFFDGSISVIRPLLETKGLVASIIPGLLYDGADTVHLVLNTLQSKVLMNTSVSKTTKLYTFSTPVVRSLIALYGWKGPRKWKPTSKSRDAADEDEDMETVEDRQIVTVAVHEFLQVLCASHKYGIIFHDRSVGTSGKKHNELLQTVLSTIEKPWEHEQTSELVLKIVISCPDLMKCVVASTETYLEPRISVTWIRTMNFIRQLVQSMDPEQCLKPSVGYLTVNQVTTVMQTLTVPSVVLRAINAGIFEHRHLVVRHEALNLLLVMLSQFNQFVTAVDQWNVVNVTALHAFKQSVMKQLPTVEIILSLWKMALSPSTENEEHEGNGNVQNNSEPHLSSHLLTLVDLLLLYNKCFPNAMDIPSSVNFLADIELLSDENPETVAALEGRVLHLLITLDSFAFMPDKEMFGDAIQRLSHLVNYPSATIPLQARSMLCSLLMNTGLFEGTVSEVFLWLHCYLAVPTEHVTTLLVDAIVSASQNPTDYITQSEEAAGGEDKKILDNTVMEGIFDELLDEEKVQRADSFPLICAVTLSPLLPAVLETVTARNGSGDELENVRYFISCVVIHLLHSQTSPETVLHVVQHWPDALPDAVISYIKGWSSEGIPQPLQKPFGSKSPESRISKALLQQHDEHVLSVGDEISTSMSASVSSKVQIMLLYKLCVFYMLQLASRGLLTERLGDNCRSALQTLLNMVSNLDEYQEEEFAVAPSEEMLSLCKKEHLTFHCLKHTFTHPLFLSLFTPFHRKKHVSGKVITEVVLDLVKLSSLPKQNMEAIAHFLKPYKEKLINQIIKKIQKCKNDTLKLNRESITPLVELFDLDDSDVTKLVEYVMTLPLETFSVSADDSSYSLSVWGKLLIHLLDRCVVLHKAIKPSQVTFIANRLVQLSKQENVDFVLLEEHFLQYLEQFPHHLDHIPTRLLHSILQQQVPSSSSTKLSLLLVTRKPVHIHDFISFARQNKKVRQNAELFFSLLAVALRNDSVIEPVFLNKIYNENSSEILEAVLKPSKAANWVKCHVPVVTKLVSECMGIDTCRAFVSEARRLDSCESFYIQLVKCIFKKVAQNEADNEEPKVTFALLLLEIFSKENVLDQKNMENLCCELKDWFLLDKNWTVVKESTVWSDFIKTALKFGLQSHTSGVLLETLSKLCNMIYEDHTEDPQIDVIFQWTLSHSEFLTSMLGRTPKKCQLVELLKVLVKKNPMVMSSSHIPVLFSSYNASMEHADQLILQLLQVYEAQGVSMYDCRPYLWGEAAVTHYSVKSKVGTSLWRQPHTNQVLELLNMDCVLETIKKFPLNRRLDVLAQDSQSSAIEPESMVYDPAFFLPLFSHLLAPEAVVQTHKFISSGGLALALAALASRHEDTRAAAFHVIVRLYFHEEAVRSVKGRLLSLQFLQAIRNGIIDLKNRRANPQLPCIVTTFLARTSIILSQTHHAMYIPLQNFIIAKSSLDMNAVPEFFTLFHSSEVEYRMYRIWILQIIRDGLKSDVDFKLSQRCVVFKLLLGFYSSVLADDDSKKLILEVIESSVKIKAAAEVLVSCHGLISWLHHMVRQLSPEDNLLISATVNIINSLWNTLSSSALKDNSGSRKKSILQQFPQHLLLLMLELLPKLGSKLAASDVRKYLCTMEAAMTSKATCSVISVQNVSEILQLSKVVLGSVSDCEDLLTYGCKFAQIGQAVNSGIDSERAASHLRNLVVKWLQIIYNSQAPK